VSGSDALMKALNPKPKKQKADEDEPSYGHRYQGPPTIQPEGKTND
jgi:hypothetical protein